MDRRSGGRVAGRICISEASSGTLSLIVSGAYTMRSKRSYTFRERDLELELAAFP
jgi:hypothetical protein